MSDTIHASCVAIEGRGVLLRGRSGSGKSDLALRLIDRGARLVSDDYSVLAVERGQLVARPPERIAGLIEVRGIGIVEMAHERSTAVALLVDLDQVPERLPARAEERVLGVSVPKLALAAFEASAPLKVELALRELGR